MAEENIEVGSETPPLGKIIEELQQAQSDTNSYRTRMDQAHRWWRCIWNGQTWDGRKHVRFTGEESFPWEGASDARLRTVATLIREHVDLARMAFFKAKVQARSMRPLTQQRQSQIATRLLNWEIYNHMWTELLRELPLAWSWRFGYGVALIGIEWEQQRRIEYHELSLPDLADVMGTMMGGAPAGNGQGPQDPMLYLMDAIMDPAHEDDLTTIIQQASPILTRPKARALVKDLREMRVGRFPVAYPFLNRPRWTALRPCIDVLFPSETSDLQESRWVARREWVTETQLQDRIETDDYDPGFVEEAKKHKGQSELIGDVGQSGVYTSTSYWQGEPPGSFRDLIELYHFYYKAVDEGVPCLYKTVFNALCKKAGEPMYAKHGLFEYEHGQYPFVILRRMYEDRKILSSTGIAEEAYTDEQAIKAQQDGLTDRTSIVHSPPMIVPMNKVAAMKGQRLPGAILGVSRPNEVAFMPLPPTDGTPLEVIRLVQERLDRRYALWGNEVDPQLKTVRQQELADEINGEMCLVLEQTLQLMQQYLLEPDVARIAGVGPPFNVPRADIQGKFEITAAVDVRMVDPEYAAQKLQLIGTAMQFNQGGTANVNALFKMAMEAIDPDAADIGIVMDDQIATDKERQDELVAVSKAMNGIESDLPMHGNHELRLQTLVSATLQSPNPLMKKRLQENPDSVAILQKRAQFFMNQIQQYTQNPQIGRALSTQTFQPKMAPKVTMEGSGGMGGMGGGGQ
jgi:hypothetical protein